MPAHQQPAHRNEDKIHQPEVGCFRFLCNFKVFSSLSQFDIYVNVACSTIILNLYSAISCAKHEFEHCNILP